MKSKLVNSPFTYALGMLAMMIPVQAFISFYSYYYIEKLGLGVGLATLARTIYLIWDAVDQPMLGYFSDKTRTRWGRRKPWIYSAMPFFVLTFVMMFSVPEGMRNIDIFIWFLAALLLFETVSAVLWVNYGALFPELFRGDQIRAKASAIQQGFQIVALLIGSALTPLIFAAYGFRNMAIIYALAFAVIMWICIVNVREREEASAQPPLKIKAAFRETLKNKEFWIFNIANSFAQTVNGLLASIIPFYAKYVLNIPESQVSILLASVFVSVIPLVAVWYHIVRKFGGMKSWRLSLGCYALSVIPLWFGEGLVSGIIAGVIAGFGLAGFLVTPPVVTGQIIDRDAMLTGRRREGMYTAVAGFITRSSGLIAALSFWIVGMAFGYVSGENPGPNPEAAFRYLISVVPFCLLTLAFMISLFMRGGVEEKKSPKR